MIIWLGGARSFCQHATSSNTNLPTSSFINFQKYVTLGWGKCYFKDAKRLGTKEKEIKCTHHKALFPLVKVSAIMLARVTVTTCLGHLGHSDTKKNDPICVALPKVAKGSTVSCRCW
jgi:hypothetical protein